MSRVVQLQTADKSNENTLVWRVAAQSLERSRWVKQTVAVANSASRTTFPQARARYTTPDPLH